MRGCESSDKQEKKIKQKKGGKGRDLKGSENKPKQCISWTRIEKVRKTAKRLGEVGSRREGRSRKGKQYVKEVKEQ